ncbi:MAG: hypothetical protein ACI4B3_04675, partial [Prevotella sp.]
TGKAPNAFLWLPDNDRTVKAVVFAQQNMAEEMLYHNTAFQQRMKELDVALLWVAPAFTNCWDLESGCQKIFEEMMVGLAGQSGHPEIATAPVIPLGHSAQATMPWNFAAWNPDRTLCVISFHGDAPRTNLCGYGTANVEWGRTRNIDGIPGLMIEGEYEWWEARVRPALAFRMMYPESCISFLCDAGGRHFECLPETAEYIALFIRKAMEKRLTADGKLQPLNPQEGWLAERWHAEGERPAAAPFALYKGDPHDAFWYFDEEMARLTESRYAATYGKKPQTVGFEYEGKPVPFNKNYQGGMRIEFNQSSAKDPQTIRIRAIHTSNEHAATKPRIEVICGPAVKTGDNTFRIVPYEAGMDNPRRSFTVWLIAIAEGDDTFKRAVQPIEIRIKSESPLRLPQGGENEE